MPRRDRSFTSDDVIRIMCNNLDGYEFLKTRLRIAFDPCDTLTGFCGVVKDLLRICSAAAFIDDSGVLSLIGRVPYAGTAVAAIVRLLSSLEPYIELTDEIICKEGGGENGQNSSVRSITVEGARDLIERAFGSDEIEDQASRIEDEKEGQMMLDYEPLQEQFKEQLEEYFSSNDDVYVIF